MKPREILAKSKLLRTLKDLFVNPAKVVESAKGAYQSGFEYLSSLTGIIFFVILLLDKLLFREGLIGHNWRLPERLQLHHNIVDNVYEDFYGFIFTTGLLPGLLIGLILFYIRNKSFTFLLNLTCYVAAQLLLLMSPLIVLNYLFEFNGDDILIIILVVYFVYFFISLQLNNWLLSTVKAVLILSLGLFGLSLVEKPLEHFFITLMERPNQVHEVTLTDPSIFKKEIILNSQVQEILEVEVIDNLIFFRDDYRTLGAVTISGEFKWEKTQGNAIDKIILIEEHKLLCAFMDTLIHGKTKDLIRGFDFEGKVIFSITLDQNLQGRAYNVIDVTDDSFELLLPAEIGIHEMYTYQKATLTKGVNNQWTHHVEPLFQSSQAIYDMTNVFNTDVITTTAETDGWQYASFGIARMDSLMNPLWKQTIYDKKNPYDPRVPAYHVVNLEQNEIMTHYSIANDTSVMSYLQTLDIATGNLKWKKNFTIPADFTEYFRMDYDDNYLYIVGESHVSIRRYFWQPFHHVAMVCKIDRRNGELVSFKHFGNTDFEGHTRVSDLVLTDNSVLLFGARRGGDSFSSEEDHLFMWEIAKEDI